MNIDINTIVNIVLTAVVGYISWSFKERDGKKETRINSVEKSLRKLDYKVSENDTKYYRDFVTKEEHDMDVNAILKKLDEINAGILRVNREIGILIGRGERNGQ